VLRRVLFYLAHADAGVPYDFYVALSVRLYDFIIPLIGEKLPDATARFISCVSFITFTITMCRVCGAYRSGAVMPCPSILHPRPGSFS